MLFIITIEFLMKMTDKINLIKDNECKHFPLTKEIYWIRKENCVPFQNATCNTQHTSYSSMIRYDRNFLLHTKRRRTRILPLE